jgi:hypothetical protein
VIDMRFFHHRRPDEAAPVPVEPVEPAEPLPASPVFSVDRRSAVSPAADEPMSDDEVLARLERTLLGLGSREHRREPVDLLDRVFELAGPDWSEQEAGAELAWLADYDRRLLKVLHQRLVAGLVRNPFPDVCGVRASRIAAAAMRQCSARSRELGWSDAPSLHDWR